MLYKIWIELSQPRLWDVHHQDTQMNMNEFEVHDFIDEPNFDQFINLIRGDNEDPLLPAFDPIPDLINACFPPFDYSNIALGVNEPIPNSALSSCFGGEINKPRGEAEADHQEENDHGDVPSATTIKHRTKPDRSKTLISERRRRGRMKQTLYALRSLVPSITKMDKASIVGDAVSYVQELQTQAEKLKAEVEVLEASLLASSQGSVENPLRIHSHFILCKNIMQMEVMQVEERGFYVKVVSNKGEGVASSLYRAFESLSGFSVRNSNLATLSDTFQLTLTLKVKSCEAEINLQNVKLWLAGALLNQGFEFMTCFPA